MNLIAVLVSIILSARAWHNPCATKAVPFQYISHDKPSVVSLESRRIVAMQGDTFTYNLGTEHIFITADSFAAHSFLEDVRAGRCSASLSVKLIPFRRSPFNTQFKTADGEMRDGAHYH